MSVASRARCPRGVLPQHQCDAFPLADWSSGSFLVDPFRWRTKTPSFGRAGCLRDPKSVPLVLWENIPTGLTPMGGPERPESASLVLWENILTGSKRASAGPIRRQASSSAGRVRIGPSAPPRVGAA